MQSEENYTFLPSYINVWSLVFSFCADTRMDRPLKTIPASPASMVGAQVKLHYACYSTVSGRESYAVHISHRQHATSFWRPVAGMYIITVI